jgi:hypothetical protein
MLILAAICLFIIAAGFGLVILTAILRDQPTPKPFVLIHGPLAALAIVLVVIDVARGHAAGLLIASLIIFIVAAIGGFTLLTLDTLHKRIPKPLAILHPLIAVTGLIVLIVYALQ